MRGGMRKWIVIGLLAVLLIALVIFFVSEPKKGSVEDHKRGLKAAATNWGWIRSMPDFVRDLYQRRQIKRWNLHWQALVEAGYLTERDFTLPNGWSSEVADVVWSAASQVFTNDGDLTIRVLVIQWAGPSEFGYTGRSGALITQLTERKTNTLRVTAPAESMSKLEELIREAVASESGR
jgi:hypothetical protein